MTSGGALRWDWNSAALGLVYALPAGVVAYSDVARGAAFAVGVVPAAVVGLAPTRRARLKVVVLGVMTGVPLVLGTLVSGIPWLAVAAMFLLSCAAVILARSAPIGSVLLVLSLPLAGVGLSYRDLAESVGLAALLITGSLYAALVSMLWPTRPRGQKEVARPPTLEYGVRLGAAAAAAAGIGFMFGLQHVGWATAAVLLVMRPGAEQTTARMIGRIASVATGGAAAVVLVITGSTAVVYSATIVVCIAASAATLGSRWYVTPAFTTFLVLLLLVAPSPEDAGFRFTERLTETLLGVGLAWIFGVALPAVLGSAPESEEPSTPPRRTRP